MEDFLLYILYCVSAVFATAGGDSHGKTWKELGIGVLTIIIGFILYIIVRASIDLLRRRIKDRSNR